MQSPFEATYIPQDTQVIFVNDFFVEHLIGGAELTTQAIIDSLKESNIKTTKIQSNLLSSQIILENRDKLWILCNFANASAQAISTLSRVARYIVIEYDFKFCSSRSPDKHKFESKKDCDCANQQHGKFITQVFNNALSVLWMSEAQKNITKSYCKDLNPASEYVASSIFDDNTIEKLISLKNSTTKPKDVMLHDSWLILKSNSWIKGTQESLQFAIKNNLKYELIGNVAYDVMLQALSAAKGIIYQPPGGDTCPRIIIEAQILGVELKCNDNVLHLTEQWTKSDSIVEYLRHQRNYVKNLIINLLKPKISGYVTTLNAIEKQYPIVDCVKSMTNFCSEVIVLDGGSTDSTVEAIKNIKNSKIKIYTHKVDLNAKDFALEDGRQKARARSYCTGDFCWQQDADEIVDIRDADDILLLAAKMPETVSLIALPVVEFWGSLETVRCDITPWKWRLSKNNPDITHGVPIELRTYDADNNLIVRHGSDGCDMISVSTGKRIDCASFVSENSEFDRQLALQGNSDALERYSIWFNQIIMILPPVFHVSWLDLKRKINLYKNYWTNHWANLYNEKSTNMFFNKDWSEVTENDIDNLVEQLKQIGGWIWHKPWDGTNTPKITCNRMIPNCIVGAK